VEFSLMMKGELPYSVSHKMANKMEKVFRTFKAQTKIKMAPTDDKNLANNTGQQPIQPTSVKDRERLLAKKPTPEIMPEGEDLRWAAVGGRFITPKHKKSLKKPNANDAFKSKPKNIYQSAMGVEKPSDQVPPVMSESLLDEVKQYGENEHPEGLQPEDFAWEKIKGYPMKNLIHLMPGGVAGWKHWLTEELKSKPGQWDELAKKPNFKDPIIVSPGHIWDGWHRVASAIVNGLTKAPAIFGRPK